MLANNNFACTAFSDASLACTYMRIKLDTRNTCQTPKIQIPKYFQRHRGRQLTHLQQIYTMRMLANNNFACTAFSNDSLACTHYMSKITHTEHMSNAKNTNSKILPTPPRQAINPFTTNIYHAHARKQQFRLYGVLEHFVGLHAFYEQNICLNTVFHMQNNNK